MLGRTHVMVNTAIYTGVVAYQLTTPQTPVNFPLYVSGLAGLVIGSLLPDIDTPSSLLGRHVKWFSNFLYNTIGHRTITHTLWALLLVGVLGFFIMAIDPLLEPFGLMLILGFVAHLIEDAFSLTGINFFWPIPKRKRWRKFVYRVGGGVETIIFALSCVLNVIFILKLIR